MSQKYVAVTGASGGFGGATCKLLLDAGYYVLAFDKVKTVYDHKNLLAIKVDISNQSSVEESVKLIASRTDRLDGLVNIAGAFDQFPLAEVDADRFYNLISSNLVGHQILLQALFPFLHHARGRIINISSETVLAPMPLQSYAFTKSLFETWNDQLRLELGLLNMKVIKIRPGGHLTPFVSSSKEVISQVDGSSLFTGIMRKTKKTGIDILGKVHHDPIDVAKVILKALKKPNPALVYHVNVSWLFKLLSLIPARVREKIFIKTMKRWL